MAPRLDSAPTGIAGAILSFSGLQLAGLATGLLIAYRLAIIIHRLTLHPLAKFPGPKLYASSQLPYEYLEHLQGTFVRHCIAHRKRYGPVFRIGPNHLAVDGAIGWHEVCAPKPGQPEWAKMQGWYFPGDHLSIIASDKDNHRRMRRQLAHAFSDRSMYEQEAYITKYVDLLCAQLGKKAAVGEAVNFTMWANFTTFDIIGDLAFADSFHSLDSGDYHPWVALMSSSLRNNAFRQIGESYPLVKTLMKLYASVSPAVSKQLSTVHLGTEKAMTRVAMGESPGGRRDFMTHMLKQTRDGGPGYTEGDIRANVHILVSAGSDTTSIALTGAVFYLARNPRAFEIVADEVRGAFRTADEIDFKSTARLQYLFGVIEETLRICPPASDLPPRISPGAYLNGQWVPKGVKCTVITYTTNRNPEHWHDPEGFHPERWLPATHAQHDAARFAGDNKAAFRPFSNGTRDCIGKNLAYSELRIILSKLLFFYDWRLQPGMDNWHERCRGFSGSWEKPPLDVLFRKRP